MIFVGKINKSPEFYMIFARKMPEYYIIIARKVLFPGFFFFGGGGHVPPCPPSPTPMFWDRPSPCRGLIAGFSRQTSTAKLRKSTGVTARRTRCTTSCMATMTKTKSSLCTTNAYWTTFELASRGLPRHDHATPNRCLPVTVLPHFA